MASLSAAENTKTAVTSAEDIEDVRQSRKGDSDAYRRLVVRYQDYVGRILWRFSRDPRVHEELIQDVFVEAYLSLGSYRHKAPFAHWLSRIATRVGYRHWKKTRRQKSVQSFSLQEWDQIAGEKAEQIDPDEAAQAVHALMERLSPRDRLVLTLRYLEQCTVAETARQTGWTRTMVKVQTFRALRRLEKLLARMRKEGTR
jgi:RNA polymerase sigma-70 factor (ECF subfamily)